MWYVSSNPSSFLLGWSAFGSFFLNTYNLHLVFGMLEPMMYIRYNNNDTGSVTCKSYNTTRHNEISYRASGGSENFNVTPLCTFPVTVSPAMAPESPKSAFTLFGFSVGAALVASASLLIGTSSSRSFHRRRLFFASLPPLVSLSSSTTLLSPLPLL